MTKEESLTIACVTWFKTQYSDKIIIHNANERNTSIQRGAKLKRMGVLAGVSDIFIPEMFCVSHEIVSPGLWIELKIKGNYPSVKQREFLYKMFLNGYAYAVAWSLDEFRRYVKNYFKHGYTYCDYTTKMILKMEGK